MQPALILRAEAAATRDLLHLLLSIPENAHFGADCAAVALRAGQTELDPFISGINSILIQQEWPILVGYKSIQGSIVVEIRECNGSPVETVRRAHELSNLLELACAVIDPNPLLLIAREAAAFEGWPVGCIRDDPAIAAGYL